MSIRTVGFLGLGIMGSRMARNLAQKGFTVVAWNRTRCAVGELAQFGWPPRATPAELASQVDAFCTPSPTARAARRYRPPARRREERAAVHRLLHCER